MFPFVGRLGRLSQLSPAVQGSDDIDFFVKCTQLMQTIVSDHMGVFDADHAYSGIDQFRLQGDDHSGLQSLRRLVGNPDR